MFEIRFVPTRNSVAELLPGILYQTFREQYPDFTTLPLAGLPKELRMGDPNMPYMASHRLISPAGHIFVGDKVVGVTKMTPYLGWDDFRTRIRAFLDALRAAQFVSTVERYSLKSINILNAPAGHQLSILNANLQLAGRNIPETGFRLRLEYVDGPQVQIVQIATNTKAEPTGRPVVSGLLVEIDCIRSEVLPDFWGSIPEALESLHMTAKTTFFSLLTQNTVDRLEPVYE